MSGVPLPVQEDVQNPVLLRRQRGAEGGPVRLQVIGGPAVFPGFQVGRDALLLGVFVEGLEESFHEIGSFHKEKPLVTSLFEGNQGIFVLDLSVYVHYNIRPKGLSRLLRYHDGTIS